MTIETKFDIGQLIVLKTDSLKQDRMVISIQLNPNGAHRYCTMQGATESWHSEIEMEATIKTNGKAGFKK